jgi:hypothetical protein
MARGLPLLRLASYGRCSGKARRWHAAVTVGAGDGPRVWEENASLPDSRWLLGKLRHSPLRKPPPTFILVWFSFRFSQLSLTALPLLLRHRQLQLQHTVLNLYRSVTVTATFIVTPTNTKVVQVSGEETVQNTNIHWEIIYVPVQHIPSCV